MGTKKEKPDPRFRTIEDFRRAPSSLQEFVLFEDGRYSPAKLDMGKLREIYSNAIEILPAQRLYLYEGKWIPETKIGKRDRQGLEYTYVERRQVRTDPFSQLDGAVVELGNRAFDLMQLNVDMLSQRVKYVNIISILQKEGLVTKI